MEKNFEDALAECDQAAARLVALSVEIPADDRDRYKTMAVNVQVALAELTSFVHRYDDPSAPWADEAPDD